MSLIEKTKASTDALREATLNIPLVLIHPETKYASLHLSNLLQDSTVPSYYFDLQEGDEALSQCLNHLYEELSLQVKSFKKVFKADASTSETLALAKQVAQDLGSISSDDYLLILDDFDIVDRGEEVQPFLTALLEQLPKQVHLLLKVRHLPRLPWLALLAKEAATIFLQDGLMLDNPLSFATEGKQHLENFAFGSGKVFLDGKQIETWEGTLPRQLYFFVLLQGQVTRAQICQAFWPDLPLDQAVNVFHVTKRRLHKALGVDILQFEGEVYQIAEDYRISLDALRFIETLLKARQTEGNEARKLYQVAIHAYRAALLQGAKEAWAKDFRAAFQSAYREALLASARLTTDVQAQNSDLDRYRLSLEEEPFNEKLQTKLLQAYINLGRRDDAIEHYHVLEKDAKQAKQSFSKEFLDFAKSL